MNYITSYPESAGGPAGAGGGGEATGAADHAGATQTSAAAAAAAGGTLITEEGPAADAGGGADFHRAYGEQLEAMLLEATQMATVTPGLMRRTLNVMRATLAQEMSAGGAASPADAADV